jgi:soluble lytic murein transglycosylase-like protein
MIKEQLLLVAKRVAEAAKPKVEFALLCSLIEQESDWNIWAWNPEPKYKWVWNVKRRAPFRPLTYSEVTSPIPPKDFPTLAGDKDQEWQAQRSSWGLLQLMGAVPREYDFDGLYLTELLDPELNLYYGCIHFNKKLKRTNGNIEKALLQWNGGGNPNYPKEVLQRKQAYLPSSTVVKTVGD